MEHVIIYFTLIFSTTMFHALNLLTFIIMIQFGFFWSTMCRNNLNPRKIFFISHIMHSPRINISTKNTFNPLALELDI